MPIYEYQCSECAHQQEALQKISDAPLVECPACGKPSLKKLVSAAGFRLKGGGWYETDFKTGSKQNLAESESTDKKGEAAKTEKGDGGKSAGAATEKSGKDSKTPAAAKPAKAAGNSASTSGAGQPG